MVPLQDTSNTLDAFKHGDRVQVHPATDIWMMGDTHGRVTEVFGGKVSVKMERSKRTRRFLPGDLLTTKHI